MADEERMMGSEPVTQRDLQRFMDLSAERHQATVSHIAELKAEVDTVQDKVTNHIPTQITEIAQKLVQVDTTQKLTLNTFVPVAVALGASLVGVVVGFLLR